MTRINLIARKLTIEQIARELFNYWYWELGFSVQGRRSEP